MTGRERIEPEPIPHRSERIRKAFGFSRFRWYVIAPVELRVRHLIWRLRRG